MKNYYSELDNDNDENGNVLENDSGGSAVIPLRLKYTQVLSNDGEISMDQLQEQ